MDLKGTCQIVKMNSFSEEDQSYLHLLYFPLMHSDAVLVYQVLLSLANKKEKYDQSFLIGLTFFSEVQFERARKVLENYNLLMTYYQPSTKHWVYQLYPPLNAHDFLTHDTFSRLFLKEMGSKHFDKMKLLFQEENVETKNMINVSSSLDLSRLDSWDEDNEDLYQRMVPKAKDGLKKYPFDFNEFFDGMERTLPQRIRSTENMTRIAELATIYGVTEKKMRTFVSRSLEDNKSTINFEKLRDLVMRSRNEFKESDGYSMAPIKYFSMKQRNVPVSKSDKTIIESLCTEYGFSFEVVNVLIDYVLAQTGQKFPKAFVEKVASTWVRLGVDSLEKAIEQTRGNTSLDNTYTYSRKVKTIDFSESFVEKEGEIEMDRDELLAQALAAQASLKED
ncbi:MAG: DnaD domain protein [Bacillota bacterium]|nr:DnaD domain protein [Bacillota bacterium]